MEAYGDYKILVDKRWSLEDLYLFSRAFEQVYFAYEALIPAADDQVNERILGAFNALPWRGGYSAVSFYNQLKIATPRERRPTIRQIRYASPGFIQLELAIPLAMQIAVVVTAVSTSLLACNKVYNSIYTDAQKRKLLALDIKSREVEVANSQMDFIRSSSEELASLLKLESLEVIESRTEHPLIAMKILMSIFRRVRTLAEFQSKGKAKLSQKSDKEEED